MTLTAWNRMSSTRDADIVRRYRAGATLEVIGRIYGLTRVRVRQILLGRLGTHYYSIKDDNRKRRSEGRRRE